MKVTVIGGGSSYTPELVNGFLTRVEQFPLRELWLHDVLPERLEIVGGFARRMVDAVGRPFSVHLSSDRRAAISGASYVTTQMRVGWMEARREDEYLGRRHGLVGQETTGVGGMANALRTIPVVLEIAADMRELAPDAPLINFTNPAGLITEALARYAPDITAVGVCNVPITAKMMMLEALDLPAEAARRAELDTLGLNHLSWHRGLSLDGEDLWPLVMQRLIDSPAEYGDVAWDPDLLRALNMVPNYYLEYYYDTTRIIAGQEAWPPSRAEQVMTIEAELLKQYAEPQRSVPPQSLLQRGGAYYSTVAAQLLNAHYNDLGETHVINVPHNGAIADWPGDWVLELPCRIDQSGFAPLPAPPLPTAAAGLLAQVKAFEQLTVEAAVSGDRDLAFQALLAHPLGPPAHRVRAVLDDMLQTNKPYLPRFWPSNTHAGLLKSV